jgi:hypothetical protein
VKVAIPYSAGEVISDLVMKSIQAQTMKVDVHTVCNPERFVSRSTDREESYKKRLSIIARSRNLCLSSLIEDDISVMNDSTLGHDCVTNLQEMYDLLTSDDSIVAVALPIVVRPWFKLEMPHIQNGCIMARKEVWQKVDFNARKEYSCTCMAFVRAARSLGIYRYLDIDRNRVFKIKKHGIFRYDVTK